MSEDSETGFRFIDLDRSLKLGNDLYGDFIAIHITGRYPMEKAKVSREEAKEIRDRLDELISQAEERKRIEDIDWDEVDIDD